MSGFKDGNARKYAQKMRYHADRKPARVQQREEQLALEAADAVPAQERTYELEVTRRTRKWQPSAQDATWARTTTTTRLITANTTSTTTTTSNKKPTFHFTGKLAVDTQQFNTLKESGHWTALGVACLVGEARPDMTAEEIVRYMDKLEGPSKKGPSSAKKFAEAIREEMYKTEFYVNYVPGNKGTRWGDLRNHRIVVNEDDDRYMKKRAGQTLEL